MGKNWKGLEVPPSSRPFHARISLAAQTQSQVLLPLPWGCSLCSPLSSHRLMCPKSRMWQCQEILLAAREGLCRGLWERRGTGLCAQSAAGASKRASRERSGVLPQDANADPVPQCCAWRDLLLPGAGPGLAHLLAGTRVALVKGEGGDTGAECMRDSHAGAGQTHSLCCGQKRDGGSRL